MSTKSHRTQFSTSLVLIALLSLLRLASAGCYWENGTDRNAAYNATNNYTLTIDYYQPCPANPGASASMCCAAGNVCQPNGLCWDPGYAIYWRESCSDRSWESSGCIKLFINGTGAGDDIVVTECDDGSFCYTNKNFDCCSAGEGVYIVNGDQKPHDFNSTSTSSSTTSQTLQTSKSTSNVAATTTTGSSSGTTSTTKPVPSAGLSTGAKTGIGVGVALGALLVLGLLAWCLMRRRGSNAQAYSNNQNSTAPVEKGPDNETRADPVKKLFMSHEVDSDQYVPRAEMPSTQPPMHRDGVAELGNTERR